MLRAGLVGALCVLGLLPASAAARPRVVLGFLPPAAQAPGSARASDAVLDRLARHPQLALGFVGATQGAYTRAQALLDVTQGTRVSKTAYRPKEPPGLGFARGGRGAVVLGWPQAVKRARRAPADVEPGLLASAIPGGAGYAGLSGRAQPEAIVAADRRGRVSEVSLGGAGDVAVRARALLARHRLVVAALPPGRAGDAAVDDLLAHRAPRDLVIVEQAPPDVTSSQLLPIGIAGLRGRGTLTSDTTRRPGIVAGIDLTATILRHLGLIVPKVVEGEPVQASGDLDVGGLRRAEHRLRVVHARRVPALEELLAAWAALLLVLRVVAGPAGLRRGLRIGGLGVLWIPTVVLVTGALAPSRSVEFALIAAGCLGLGALTDALVPWPRGPAVPALVGFLAYAIDLANHSDLIVQSLLGPNPRFGARYFGIGNELEATLPVLLFVGVAAALSGPRSALASGGRSRRGAWVFGLTGLALGLVIGSGRLGADVGGVVTVGAGAATAVVLMLPGGPTRRAVVLALFVPFLSLVALAGLDLATGGNSHFTRTVLHAGSEGDLVDIVRRRFQLAFNQLVHGLMPLLTALALAGIAYGIRHRRLLYAPLNGSAPWTAALAACVASAVAGALANDSGPILLVFGVFGVLFVTIYVRGDPRLARR